MTSTLVGVQGHLAGQLFLITDQPLTLGRGSTNDVVLEDVAASRVHAELRRNRGGVVVKDLGSGNGTFVNGKRVTSHRVRSGDTITIGAEVFRYEVVDRATVRIPSPEGNGGTVPAGSPPVLRVTIAGGGPVGMSFALLLDHLLGPRVSITIHDGRWTAGRTAGSSGRTPSMGNNRRQQVVTVQSRQFLKLPPEVQERLFRPGTFTEMWPAGPDSIQGRGPRNIRIAYIEDELLAILNEKADHIRLVTENYDAAAAARRARRPARAGHLRGRPLEHPGALRRPVRHGRREPLRARGQAGAGHGPGPAGQVAAARPDVRAADREPEPLPAQRPDAATASSTCA